MAKLIPVVYDGLSSRPADEVIDFEPGSGMTKQEFAEDCDLSKKMMRFSQTGIPPTMTSRMAQYGDFTGAPNFQEAQDIVVRAREQFEALPSDVRKEFNNNPAEFLEAVSKEENFDKFAKLGLLTEEAVKRKAAAEEKARNEALEAEVKRRMAAEKEVK